jgi:hypothetical protein
MHFAPNSTRYSDDLDFFHDSEVRVASAFARNRGHLERAGYVGWKSSRASPDSCVPSLGSAKTRRGSWRFMPLVRDPLGGLRLDPVDLAINKVLALAGRDEPRDFVDILFVHGRMLALAALCWAAVARTPGSRRSPSWSCSSDAAAPSGCLCYAVRGKHFVLPGAEASLAAQGIALHFGAPGGVLPRMADARIEETDSHSRR